MLSERHDRRMLKLGQLLDSRKAQIEEHNAGRRRLDSEVRNEKNVWDGVGFVSFVLI